MPDTSVALYIFTGTLFCYTSKQDESRSSYVKVIYSQERKEVAREKAIQVAEKLKTMKLTKAAEKVQDGIEATLTYMDFSAQDWARIRTNVSAKYSCGFPDPQVLPIIVAVRYLDYFTTIMEDRLWQVLAKPVFR